MIVLLVIAVALIFPVLSIGVPLIIGRAARLRDRRG